MSSTEDWSAATWEGSRRTQIRRSLRLTVRERLEALKDLAETSERLSQLAFRLPSGAITESEHRALSGPVARRLEIRENDELSNLFTLCEKNRPAIWHRGCPVDNPMENLGETT